MITSRPRRVASSRHALATSTGVVASLKTGTSICAPNVRSCSTAAGRWRSAPTKSGLRPCDLNKLASFAEFVVLPDPWSPAIRTTVGGFAANETVIASPPRLSVSSSRTILMICCEGFNALESSSPTARSRIRPMRLLTTSKLTSASSRARRISRSASSTSSSLSLPLPRSFPKIPSNRSVNASNIANPSLHSLRLVFADSPAPLLYSANSQSHSLQDHHQLED